jgi:hypothetical protein
MGAGLQSRPREACFRVIAAKTKLMRNAGRYLSGFPLPLKTKNAFLTRPFLKPSTPAQSREKAKSVASARLGRRDAGAPGKSNINVAHPDPILLCFKLKAR